LAPFPAADFSFVDPEAERQMQVIIDLIKKVRNIRAELNIELSKELALLARSPNGAARRLIEENSEPIRRLARVKIEHVASLDGLRHVARDVVAETEIALPLEGLIDFDKESARLTKNLAKIEKEIEQLNRRLTSPDFLERAAEDVVVSTRARYEELQEKRKRLAEILEDLR